MGVAVGRQKKTVITIIHKHDAILIGIEKPCRRNGPFLNRPSHTTDKKIGKPYDMYLFIIRYPRARMDHSIRTSRFAFNA